MCRCENNTHNINVVNIMKFKSFFVFLVITMFLSISVYKIIDICVIHHKDYVIEYKALSQRKFTGQKAPRGRILDVNGKVLVDNVGVKTIFYKKIQGITTKEEINIALSLAKYLDFDLDRITESQLKTFYLVTHNDGKNLITKEEYELRKKRKLTNTRRKFELI